MSNPEHLAALKEGVEVWNAWRRKNPKVRPDLSEAKLPKANLTEVYLSDADLEGADLRGLRYVTVEQLSQVQTLYQVRNLAPALEQGLRDAGFAQLLDNDPEDE